MKVAVYARVSTTTAKTPRCNCGSFGSTASGAAGK